MNFLFIHQNFPGQFRHILKALADNPSHTVVGIGDEANTASKPPLHPRIKTGSYRMKKGSGKETHHYIRDYEAAIRRGQEVVRLALDLKKKGFTPDLVVGHAGWGEMLFLKDVFPHAKHIAYFEFFYRFEGADVGFDPEFPASFDSRFRVRIKNSTQLLSLENVDGGISPTRWQQSRFPEAYTSKIKIIHEGIDTDTVQPDDAVELAIGDQRLTRNMKVLTYVARNLEPYRGFHVFMRTLPEIMKRSPDCRVVIVGGDSVSYGKRPPEGETYRSLYSKEIDGKVDWSRIHFTGKLPYEQYLKVLQLSSAHVYLTYPFVLSWSMLEAMAAGCRLIASKTPPVQEIVRHGHNGLLVDFFDREKLASTVADVLNNQQSHKHFSIEARKTIVEAYDLKRICLPKTIRYLESFLKPGTRLLQR